MKHYRIRIKVVILERGQLWVSHETPIRLSSHEFKKSLPSHPDSGDAVVPGHTRLLYPAWRIG
jgi:hypothetical protein